jgi:hypothetical protein
MSLYRAGLRLALFLPLGVATDTLAEARMPSGFTDVSPVFHFTLTGECDPIDRTRVRKPYTTGHYMLIRVY